MEYEHPDLQREAATQLGEIGDSRAVVPLLRLLGRSTDKKLILSVVDALGNLPDPQAVWPLLRLVVSVTDASIHNHASSSLVKVGTQQAGPLIRCLGDESPAVRRTSNDILLEIGAAAVEPLLSALDENGEKIRQQVVEILGTIGDPRAVERLILVLDDPNAVVRKRAAEALGKIGDRRAVEPLMRIRYGKNNEMVYAAAVAALCKIGDPRAAECLVGALPHRRLYGRASHALVKMGFKAVEPLIRALRSGAQVRKMAIHALLKLKDPRATEPLAEALALSLHDEDRAFRELAERTLLEMGSDAVEPLIRTLSTQNIKVCKSAILLLLKTKDPRAAEPLVDAFFRVLDDKSIEFNDRYNFKEKVAHGLAPMGSHVIGPLVRALGEKGWISYRLDTNDILPAIGSDAVEPLTRELGNKDPHTRRNAIFALGRIRDRRSVESLIGVLTTGVEKDREEAVRALIAIRSDAVEPLIQELGNKDPRVRRSAAFALGETRDLRAIEPLTRLLNHRVKEVREEAHNALVQIGRGAGGKAAELLIKSLDDDKICNSIASILGKIGDRRAIKPLGDVLERKKANRSLTLVITEALTALSR